MTDFFDELLKSVDSLSSDQVTQLLSRLEVKKLGTEKPKAVKEESPTTICPKSGRQRYFCKDCHKTFVSTSGSITHHSRLSSAQWKGLLLGMVQNLTLNK